MRSSDRCSVCNLLVLPGGDDWCYAHGCNEVMHLACARKGAGWCPKHAKQQPSCLLQNCPNHGGSK